MNSDDNDCSGIRVRGCRGSTISERDQGKRGNVALDTQELKSVRLVCVFCRDVRIIRVPAHCHTPKEVLWECLTCQKRGGARR